MEAGASGLQAPFMAKARVSGLLQIEYVKEIRG